MAMEYFIKVQWIHPQENDLDPEKEANPFPEDINYMNNEFFTLPEIDIIIDRQKTTKLQNWMDTEQS